jgi:hypothetical protein
MAIIPRAAVIGVGLIMAGNGTALAGDLALSRVFLSSVGAGCFELAAEAEGDTAL